MSNNQEGQLSKHGAHGRWKEHVRTAGWEVGRDLQRLVELEPQSITDIICNSATGLVAREPPDDAGEEDFMASAF